MYAPFIDIGIVPLLIARLLNHHHHHSLHPRLRRTLLLLSLILHLHTRTLMFTLGILDALTVALHLLSPIAAEHAATTLYGLLFLKAYYSIIKSKKPLVTTLADLLDTPNVPTKSIKDMLKALYPLNHMDLVELGIMLPLFTLVVKDRHKGVVEDATMMIALVEGCDESIGTFWRVDDVSIMEDLVVGGGARGRGKILFLCFWNLVKSDIK
ncbi:hypothetical protein GW17_00005366 [Ensete ventricosum]|nr:hypothetical protein GW17_00005366 [Ensete ventricosum]